MKLIFSIFLVLLVFKSGAQTPPPPPPAPAPAQPKQQTIGQLQNNTGQVQSRSFTPPPPPPAMGGSKIKPNPFMQTADLAVIQNPTFESGARMGFSCGASKSNFMGTKTIGANGMFTFDFTQRAVSVFTSSHNKWFCSYSFAQMGKDQTQGLSVTRLWTKNNYTFGTQVCYSLVDGSSFRISAPSLIVLVNKTYEFGKLKLTPELYSTISNPYYDRDKSEWSSELTYNGLASMTFTYKFTKRFVLNTTYRANVNTTPKFGLMNNLLIGSSFKF